MNTKKEAPVRKDVREAKFSEFSGKARVKLLFPQQKRVYSLLCSGGQYSTIDLMRELRIADPRRVIANLRAVGVKVLDCWCVSSKKARYKRYFIQK